METIDVTPTWEGLLPYLILVLEQGKPEGKKEIKKELRRMAQAADKYNEILKNQKE